MILQLRPIIKSTKLGVNELFSLNLFEHNKDVFHKIDEAWLISTQGEQITKIIDINKDTKYDLDEIPDLNEYYKKNRDRLFNNYRTEDFPLQIKLVASKNQNEILVKPTKLQTMLLHNIDLADENEEIWYFLKTKHRFYGKMIFGSKADDFEELSTKIHHNKLKSVIRFINVRPGSAVSIVPGTIYGSTKGNLIYKIYNNTDAQIEIKELIKNDVEQKFEDKTLMEAKQITKTKDHGRALQKTKLGISNKENIFKEITHKKSFKLEEWIISDLVEVNLHDDEYNFLIITCIEGSGTINNYPINFLETIIATPSELISLLLKGNMKLLVTTPL